MIFDQDNLQGLDIYEVTRLIEEQEEQDEQDEDDD